MTHIFFPLPWSCSFSNYCELCNCEHVMFQKCVCDSPNAGSGLPAKRDSEIFLASACDLESSQKNSPRSFLSFSSSLCSFLSLSPSAPSPLSSKQDSGSTLFITHQHSLYKIAPAMHTSPQLRFCQRLAPGPLLMASREPPLARATGTAVAGASAGTHRSSLGHGHMFPCDLGTSFPKGFMH